ncbi:MAG: tetratricopeptide (TPR) repeat protein, partial [Myxococcota bacterium]
MHESGNDRVAAKSLSLCELGQYTEAAELLEQHKMYARAAAAWRLANDPARAGGALERAGDLMGSLKIYEKADMTKQAASVRARLEVVAGNHYEAALLFSTAGQYKTALDHARRANRADAAATIYEAAGRPLTAAKQWIKLGKIEEAARAFTAGDKHMKAGACWQKLGNHVEMAHSLARAGKHFEAGTILQRAGELRLAVDYYEQVSGVSPHFEHAHLCRADALLALGD